MIRVTVDAARCEGHGLCESTAPEVFALDDDGTARVLVDPIPESLAGMVEATIRVCPVAALKRNADQRSSSHTREVGPP
jgi:ferredoxin